jgi:hypothetical protein
LYNAAAVLEHPGMTEAMPIGETGLIINREPVRAIVGAVAERIRASHGLETADAKGALA